MPMFLASKPNEPLIQYKHYRIDVSRVGKGWRASIYASNATHPLADSPVSLEKVKKQNLNRGKAYHRWPSRAVKWLGPFSILKRRWRNASVTTDRDYTPSHDRHPAPNSGTDWQ